ncbi:MAG: hemolysin family protein [Fibrobacter sp.]|nr:hemolysin family protein [Fibrobacter sp.]
MFAIVLTVLACLGASAFCSVTEASFYSVPPATIELLQKQKKFTAKYMTHVKENIDRYIASVLVVNTVANTVGASLATALAVRNLPPVGQVALPIVLTVLILLFGEITPKTLGVKQAKVVAPLVAVPFYYITKVLSFTGLIWLCLTLTKRWTHESEEKKDVSIDDINSLVSLGLREDVIDRQQSLVIKNILSLKSVPVRKVMTPRQVVFSLDADKTLGESLDERGNWPFSRIPLYEKNKDNWIGTILRRDAYNKLADGHRDIKLRQLMRPLQLIPDSLTLDKLLLRFLKQRGHIVGVVDEWGAIAGVVSLEDVLEEILGREIVDEYDESVDLQESARKRSKALASMREQRRAVTRSTAALARESVITREMPAVPRSQASSDTSAAEPSDSQNAQV